MSKRVKLSGEESNELLIILKESFEKNMDRHKNLEWVKVEAKLKANPKKLWSLNQMQRTGGEPDVIDYDKNADEYIFFDCSIESPNGRRSLCYDNQALESRKENKPRNSVVGMADEMRVELLDEKQYLKLQEYGNFDTKTSSWLKTPSQIRKLGGAIFADFRYGKVFVYHNGVESYYASRGFRCLLRI